MTELWHTSSFKALIDSFNKSQLAFMIPISMDVPVPPCRKENNSQYFVEENVLYLKSYSSSVKVRYAMITEQLTSPYLSCHLHYISTSGILD